MDDEIENKKRIVGFFYEKGILLNPDIFEAIKDIDLNKFHENLKNKEFFEEILILNRDITKILDKNKNIELDWKEFEKAATKFEKNENAKIYGQFLEFLSKEKKEEEIMPPNNGVKVIFSYIDDLKQREAQDFTSFFNARHRALEKILRNRQEIINLTSISKIIIKKDRSEVSLIGIVKEIAQTKNKNLVMVVEDPTGEIKILVNKNKPELYAEALNIVPDEVIGIVGVNGDNIVFADNILWPEVPLTRELKKSPDEAYAIFLSDLHVGSKQFLPEEFNKFIKWINGGLGDDAQQEIARKIKYIFIAGDLVDGVGVYPEQDSELEIKDIYDQYNKCAELLQQIPKNIQLIICPGNHDAMRIAEPQPQLYKDFAGAIWQLPNVTMVSNPAVVRIHETKDFSGFDVLLYHGYSFDYYVAHVDSIRRNGGYDRADLIMSFLLKRRHLAPTHTSTLYMPDANKDSLVIDIIPDFFVTGHIHKTCVAAYKNITMICGSCWQSTTTFQEKVGHHPEPARVPIVNLQTRKIKILRFG